MSKIATPEKVQDYLQRFVSGVKRRNPGEPEFHQAVYEVAQSVFPYIADNPSPTKASWICSNEQTPLNNVSKT